MNCPIQTYNMSEMQTNSALTSNSNNIGTNFSAEKSENSFDSYLQNEKQTSVEKLKNEQVKNSQQTQTRESSQNEKVKNIKESSKNENLRKNDSVENQNSTEKANNKDIGTNKSSKLAEKAVNSKINDSEDAKNAAVLEETKNINIDKSSKKVDETEISLLLDSAEKKESTDGSELSISTVANETKLSKSDKETKTESSKTAVENTTADASLITESAEKLSKAVTAENDNTKDEKNKKNDDTKDVQSSLAGTTAQNNLTKTVVTTDALIANTTVSNSSNLESKKSTKDDAIIKVVDERTTIAQVESSSTDKLVTHVSADSNGNAQMTLDLAGHNAPQLQDAQGVVTADSSAQNSFSQMLHENLQSNTQEFVKAGTIALKDNNQGSINLILHPDDLGNVKIKLEISDNVLKGKIVVATKEAYNAFKDNLSNLKQAFTANGFDSAAFDVAWSGSGTEQSFGGNENPQQGSKNPFAKYYEDGLAEIDEMDSLNTNSSYNEVERQYIDITA